MKNHNYKKQKDYQDRNKKKKNFYKGVNMKKHP